MCKASGYNQALEQTQEAFNDLAKFFDELKENEEIGLCPEVRAQIRELAVEELGPAMAKVLSSIAFSAMVKEAEEALTFIDPRRN